MLRVMPQARFAKWTNSGSTQSKWAAGAARMTGGSGSAASGTGPGKEMQSFSAGRLFGAGETTLR